MSIFEEASRCKLRFKTKAGFVSADDLWDLPLKQLDEIAVAINHQINSTATGSFLTPKSGPDKTLQLTLDILVHIMKTRQEEAKAAKEKEQRSAQKGKLLEIIAQKQDEQLTKLSVEELLAKVNEL